MSPIDLAHRWLFETHPNAGVAVIYGSLNAMGDTCAQVFFSDKSYDPARTLRFFIFGVGIAPLALMWNAYLERKYPLRPSSDDDDLSLPSGPATAPEYVPLESVKVDIPPADSPRLHRRTASTVSQNGGEKTPAMKGGGGFEELTTTAATTTKASLPPVDKIVLLRRVAADQLLMAPISFIVFLVCMGLMEFRSPVAIMARIRSALIPILLTNYKVWPFVQCVMFLYVPLQYRVPLSGVINVAWTIYLSWENARTAA
ncbi:hypothetical protein JCM10908_007133 [Rhodotorula pacifica]|uniref:Mpv17/PMP22 family protein n=1 Tax=Rhodotorula pacifica TaxID=1495444 RepID=UPI00317D0332